MTLQLLTPTYLWRLIGNPGTQPHVPRLPTRPWNCLLSPSAVLSSYPPFFFVWLVPSDLSYLHWDGPSVELPRSPSRSGFFVICSQNFIFPLKHLEQSLLWLLYDQHISSMKREAFVFVHDIPPYLILFLAHRKLSNTRWKNEWNEHFNV